MWKGLKITYGIIMPIIPKKHNINKTVNNKLLKKQQTKKLENTN